MLLRENPRVAYYIIKALRAERRGYLLRRGIYALHAAPHGTVHGLFDKLQFGVSHRQLAAIEHRAAEDEIFAPHLHVLLHPLYAAEPDELGRPRGVGHIDREALLAARARIPHARHSRAELHQRRSHALVDLGYAVYLGAVDVTERIVAQQIADGEYAQLLFENLGARLADARNVFHAAVENIRHNAKISDFAEARRAARKKTHPLGCRAGAISIGKELPT